MKKIAILNCIDSAIKCSSVDCFGFFQNRERSFSRYEDEDVYMGACVVCDCCKHKDGFENILNEKIERLKKHNIDDVHVSACVTSETKNCEYTKKVIDKLRDSGFNVFFIKPSSRTESL